MDWTEIDTRGIHSCYRCEGTGSDIDPLYFGPDPYDSEINHNDEPVWLHARCYAERVADI